MDGLTCSRARIGAVSAHPNAALPLGRDSAGQCRISAAFFAGVALSEAPFRKGFRLSVPHSAAFFKIYSVLKDPRARGGDFCRRGTMRHCPGTAARPGQVTDLSSRRGVGVR